MPKSFTHRFTDIFGMLIFFVSLSIVFIVLVGNLIGGPYGFIIAGLAWVVTWLLSIIGALLAKNKRPQ